MSAATAHKGPELARIAGCDNGNGKQGGRVKSNYDLVLTYGVLRTRQGQIWICDVCFGPQRNI